MSLDYFIPHPPCSRSPRPAHPYESALSSSASSSASSIFSIDASSLSSQSSQSTQSSVADFLDACRVSLEPPRTAKRVLPPPPIRSCTAPVAPEHRQHPRRCSTSNNRPPPALVRQSERKGQFVDCLVDSATQMVEVIWPTSVPACRGESGSRVLPLRVFIQETLRRSRTSFSTLQVALYYLILIKSHVPRYDFTMEQPDDKPAFRALQCGRRMFLAALILASKYLQDRNYSARAWSKISGLKVCEININETAFLAAVQWKLHIKEAIFEKWQDVILHYTPSSASPLSPGGTSSDSRWTEWKILVQRLTPDLEGIALTPRPLRLACQPRKASTWPLPQSSPATPTTPVTPTPMSAGFSTSTESTPTPTAPFCLPQYFEPRLDVGPPTPARLGPLPTPSMTPQSSVSASGASTPAASLLGATIPQRPSMCAAMQTAQSVFSTRMADPWSCSAASSRRTSLAPSTTYTSAMSMNSSPESMVSDASSRSSRASSISSASSVSSAGYYSAQTGIATPVKLARLAALRCAGLNTTTLATKDILIGGGCGLNLLAHASEPEIIDVDGITIEPVMMSSPDFDGFHIHDSVAATPAAASIPDDMARLERTDSARSSSSAASSSDDCASSVGLGSSSPVLSSLAEGGSSPIRSGATATRRPLRPYTSSSSVFSHLVAPDGMRSSGAGNRKRCRSSVDFGVHLQQQQQQYHHQDDDESVSSSIQQHVRDLLAADVRAAARNAHQRAVADDDAVASSFVLGGGARKFNLPQQQHVYRDGSKRVRCAKEGGGGGEQQQQRTWASVGMMGGVLL